MTTLNINNLSQAQKIGQLIMPRIDFKIPETIERARILVQEFEVGGFIIFNGKRDIVSEITRELQSISNIPLLFGCDAERGLGQIVSDKTLYPFTMSLGATRDEELVYKQASFIAEEMNYCGLNLIFAPVADVNSNPDNPIINMRSYSDNPELVSILCSAFIKGSQDSGVIACAKHFPGHGRTGVDSHIDLPVLDQSLENLKKIDLIPFQKSIENAVAAIMTAHIAFPNIGDGNAVTLSKRLVSDVLRDTLGYKGLVITDSLHMEGIIKLGEERYLAQKIFEAGCDIILDPQDPLLLIRNLIDSKKDVYDLNSKVQRILSTKKSFPIKQYSGNSAIIKMGQNLGKQIAEKSVCLERGGTLKSNKASIYTFDVTNSENIISAPFTRFLEENGIELTNFSVKLDGDEEQIPDNISEDAAVICLVYTTIGAWKKQSILPDTYKEVLSSIESLPNETVLISFGSPYILRNFEEFKTVLCSFDILDICQAAAAGVLLGHLEPKGHLPVDVD